MTQIWDGGSSSTAPRKPQHSLRRTNYGRYVDRSIQLCGAHADALLRLPILQHAAGKVSSAPEEFADILMARKDYREAAFSYKKLVDENPHNAIYWNKLGIALHQQSELVQRAEVLSAGGEGKSAIRRRSKQYWHHLVPAQEIRQSHPRLRTRHQDAQRHGGACTAILATLISAKRNMTNRLLRSGRRWRLIRSSSSTTLRAPARCCRIAR